MKRHGCVFLLFLLAFTAGCSSDDSDDDDAGVSDDDASPVGDDDDNDDDYVDPQVEFTEPIPLLNPDGTLRAQGWARSPLIQYNPEYISEKFNLRIKEWDNYTIITPKFAFSTTISDISLATFASYEVIDFEENKVISGVNLRLGSHGGLPDSPHGSASYQNGDSYLNITYDNGVRTIEGNIARSLFGCAFSCEVVLSQPAGDENPATAAPFFDPRYYFYENKIFGMPASGSVTIDGRTYEFDAAESFAVLDWGRGVWPHLTEWHWGVAAGRRDGKIIGFNIGDGCADDSLGTANAQKCDGVLHKLYRVYFDYDLSNMMASWDVASDADKLRATFTPFFHQKSGLVILDLGMLVDKMYGAFAGRLTLDDGTEIEFDGLLGFIERSNQRW